MLMRTSLAFPFYSTRNSQGSSTSFGSGKGQDVPPSLPLKRREFVIPLPGFNGRRRRRGSHRGGHRPRGYSIAIVGAVLEASELLWLLTF